MKWMFLFVVILAPASSAFAIGGDVDCNSVGAVESCECITAGSSNQQLQIKYSSTPSRFEKTKPDDATRAN